MVHKIIGWFCGYVRVMLYGEGVERFFNLCRHHHILLWNIVWIKKGQECSCCMMLKDYRRLRLIAIKSHVWPIITKRVGGPFVCRAIWKRASFYIGVLLFLAGLFFFSSRIWGIEIEGQSYHTRETIRNYLDEKGIYEGIAAKKIVCSEIEEGIRKTFPDIGWVSIEKSGSKLYVRLREVRLIKKQKKLPAADLVAERDGTVLSIVTRGGTARVLAGKKVKKGSILIAGVLKIMDDNGEVAKRKLVRASGTVKLQSILNYQDELPVSQTVRSYTGRKKYIYQIILFGKSFFSHNPLNNLETYQKYDIIREGGRLCPSISCRFPVQFWRKTYKEVEMKKKTYTLQERKKDFQERYSDYICRLKRKGYHIMRGQQETDGIHVKKQGNRYVAYGKISVWKIQKQFVRRTKKQEKKRSNGKSQEVKKEWQ